MKTIASDGRERTQITIDDRAVEAWVGEPLAAVFLREKTFCRTTPRRAAPRAPFCMMGVCFECLAVVDGAASVQTCLVAVRPGMVVRRQNGAPRLGAEAGAP